MKLDISLWFSLSSLSVMRDVILSQNDMLPVFLVLSERECMKMLLRLVLFNIMLF